MNDTSLKAFFGCAQVLRVLRRELDLSADEQFLALCYAMCALLADTPGMSPEQALDLLQEVFDKNIKNAKAGARKSKKSRKETP